MLSKLKNVWVHSPVYKFYERHFNNQLRKKLTNENFTILCTNCIGGTICHRLGQRFNSPTVNLSIDDTHQFCCFLANLDFYLNSEFEEAGFNQNGQPCGILKGDRLATASENLPDIFVEFVHYKTFEEGVQKWNERKERINKDNIYVIMYDCENGYNVDGYAKEEDLKLLEAFPCNNKVLLTRNPDCKKPYAHYIEPNGNSRFQRKYFDFDIFGIRAYEKKFDYVAFLNKK
ncbi:MAG: DUF1919 domain-containing protein [Eubacterium sp.]|nr:DUF1919 domain-containing protein [Eubacterium sp.]